MSGSEMRCSFCGKASDEVRRLIAGPAVFICDECVGLCEKILDKEAPASFPSADGRSDEELLDELARLDASRGQLESAVRDRARWLRERSVTWARIGESLGVSRQSAWERFSGEE